MKRIQQIKTKNKNKIMTRERIEGKKNFLKSRESMHTNKQRKPKNKKCAKTKDYSKTKRQKNKWQMSKPNIINSAQCSQLYLIQTLFYSCKSITKTRLKKLHLLFLNFLC